MLAPHWDCSIERMRGQPVVLCVQDSTELDYTAQPGIAGLGPLSYLRQHGLYVHPTLAVTPDGVPLGVLDAWLWTRDRDTFGEDKRHWPIEAKESMRWLEGFERCAELAGEPTPGWSTSPTGNATSTNSWSGRNGRRESTG